MIVNKMTAATAPLAARLEEKLFSHPWREADFMASLSDQSRCFLTAMDDDVLVGYCGLQAAGDQGDVLTIGVDPDRRRRGIGQILMKSLIQKAIQMEVQSLFLEVRESNESARGLYEKLGFQLAGKRPGYYKDPAEDGLIYVLEVQK